VRVDLVDQRLQVGRKATALCGGMAQRGLCFARAIENAIEDLIAEVCVTVVH
jgi:ABC-type phosphate transport system ATPase subunit